MMGPRHICMTFTIIQQAPPWSDVSASVGTHALVTHALLSLMHCADCVYTDVADYYRANTQYPITITVIVISIKLLLLKEHNADAC